MKTTILPVSILVCAAVIFASQLDVRDGDSRVKAGLIVVEGWDDLVHGQVILGPSSGVLCARP